VFTAIAGSLFNGYALKADGSIAAWGADWHKQVSEAPTGGGFFAIAAGVTTGYALHGERNTTPMPSIPEPSALLLAFIGVLGGIGRKALWSGNGVTSGIGTGNGP
jgi:hypothetical protein